MTNTNEKNKTSERSSALRSFLVYLYHQDGAVPSIFRYIMIIFDIISIAFFIYLAMSDHTSVWFRPIEITIGVIIALDFIARFIIAHTKWRYLTQLTTIFDIVVLISLFIPAFVDNFVFLRLLRVLRILRSRHIMHDLRKNSRFIKRNEEVIASFINLISFIFIMTAIVYELQVRVNDDINNLVDALYYTVTTLTTTGYGDITMKDNSGRLLSVVIMVFGVGLFLRLLQTLFRPPKVNVRCQTCGLTRHEPDASHCKHCGEIVHITNEGE